MHPHTVTCSAALDPASLSRRAPALSCAPRLWTPPPAQEGSGVATCHTVPDPRLPDREGSSAATCHMTPDPASRLERAPVLPRVIQLRTPPPCSEGFGATICPIVSDPASLLRRALVLLRVPRPSESHEP
jgi:hypothetical protein